MAIGSAARRSERQPRACTDFGEAAEAALDVLELAELAWHDCFGELEIPPHVVDDIFIVAGGNLPSLVRAARLAVADARDLRLATAQLSPWHVPDAEASPQRADDGWRMLAEPEIRRIEHDLHGDGWATHTSLDGELRVWAHLAARVNAYTFSIDDYTNDLCSRDYLAEFTARASGELKDRATEVIARYDDEFLRATVADTRGLVRRYYRIKDDDGWWWRRAPSLGPLATYLAGNDV